VPGPVPIVSPVVPLFIAPLLIPVPGLRRLAPFAELLFWLGVAGEIAESPVVVVEPVLAFCARTKEPEKISVVAAITVNFICFSNLDGMGNLRDAMPRRAHDRWQIIPHVRLRTASTTKQGAISG
jgi:hypothetical protein